ncbi:carboxymuconolactone decarboxylase family protein [Aquabacterium sp.]|uniref:carboxymuconolactone decarboxylase family protein n=1 Tax=Aquabacterium sp. TaxID=1872578 RepID=UPI003D6D77BE
MARPDPLQPDRGWAHASTPRLRPPPPGRQGLVLRGLALVCRRLGRAELPDLFPVLSIHRGLFLPWLWFASRLMPHGRLPAAVREMLILRTAWNSRCRYEWGQHVDLALAAGVSDVDILCTTLAPSTFMDPVHRSLMQACDELCLNDVVTDTVWHTLEQHWDEAHLIEITMLVGHYRMLASVINSAGLALEAPTEVRLQAFYERAIPANVQASNTRLRDAG